MELRKKACIIIAIDAKNVFDKIQHPLTKNRREHPRPDKGPLHKSTLTSSLIVQDKAFTQKPGTKLGCLLSSLLFNIVLEVQARSTRQEEEIKVSRLERKKQSYLYLQMTWFCVWKILRNPLKLSH